MRSEHLECHKKHDEGVKKINWGFIHWIDTDYPADRFCRDTNEFAQSHFIDGVELQSLTVEGFDALIAKILTDHLLTPEEETKLASLLTAFNLTLNDLPTSVAQRFIKCAILRDLDEQKLPERINLVSPVSLNLARDEKIIWIFQEAALFTMRTHTSYVGTSQGISVRLMRGLYYRVGESKGEPIKTEYLSAEGTGLLPITNLAVYFLSPLKVMKIGSKKIIAVETYSDGISITRESANAKPQFFKVDDPWFAANLITRLNRL